MAVNLHATHFRFGIEELLEATHGWHAALDTNPAQGIIASDATFLLRFTVQETGGTAAANVDNQFQCRKNLGAWQDITTTSTIAKAVVSVAFTNGQACTKRLTGTGTFESSGAGCTEDGSSGGPANDIAASGNSETECALQIVGADVAGNDVIEFRLTSPDFTITNDIVPSLTVEGATVVEADGASVGAGASSIVSASVFAGITAAAGIAASVIAGAALWVVLLVASGATAVSGIGASPFIGVASAAGVATDSIVGASPFAGIASAAGTAAGSVITGAVASSAANSDGTSTALGTATNTEAADGAANGVGVTSGIGAYLFAGTVSAAGIAAANGIGRTSIFGVTKDSAGAALGGCTVRLFRTSDDAFQIGVVSSGLGNYVLYPDVAGPFYVVAYKAGSPDRTGATVNTLTGA